MGPNLLSDKLFMARWEEEAIFGTFRYCVHTRSAPGGRGEKESTINKEIRKLWTNKC